jgi:hypothetical protein
MLVAMAVLVQHQALLVHQPITLAVAEGEDTLQEAGLAALVALEVVALEQ